MKEEINVGKALAERDELKSQLRVVRSSFSFRLGNMLIQAVCRPGRNTILLPYHLIRLFATELKKRRRRAAKIAKYTEIRLADVKLNPCSTMVKEKYM